ncbi:MarR family winged helix-turn-helix transcriptional regulator [Nocardia araoensis]|uniref:MarR family winged helix-turn-helix transcriptional regulator n=1 Tax=Nocardia araoensis TaxID=228600 RepID=UPI0002D62F5B|nr:winged helix DNA-binding protein [Nocardia araoensis]
MRPAEELRYLVLAVQREGNRMLAAELRPLGLTPSQAEVLRVLADYQPLTLAGLGELLVCETGGSPSRLVDRLVAMELIQRESATDDRRRIMLSLTPAGEQLASQVADVEERLYRTIDELTVGKPMTGALELLRGFAEQFPAVQAVGRRADRRGHR